jgi:predicted dehydrogenase/nucleoside-diphosphate-sugar epimerase
MSLSTALSSEKRARPGSPLRVAIVGCGAISRRFHLPVLSGHEGVRLVALVDHNVVMARGLADAYGVEAVLADTSDLTPETVDGVLVATPPSHHAPACIELARRGLHVLVEKPMAITQAEAVAMADAARLAGVTLATGYFRRLFPAVRLLRAALDRRTLGRVVGFDVEEGDEYGWVLTTLSNMRKDQGGGGVLIDIGSHVLDLLLYLFPGPFGVLESRDNSLGGVETDSLLRLRLERDGRPVEGRVELSRTRKLRNTLRVICERGTLELRVGERYEVAVIPHDVRLEDPVLGEPRGYTLQASWVDEPEATGYEAYREVIDDWLRAIHSSCPPRLDASSSQRTVALIEAGYRVAGKLDEPWVWEGIPQPAPPPSANGKVSAAPLTPTRARRVLITGATGFIGCRLAEVLHLGGDWEIRALVHKPGSAARLARLPVEMVQGDLKSPADLARAVEGCDAVVHCAIGTAYGHRREIFAVTVDGTRKLVEAARAEGVRRFVHLSSMAVYGSEPRGVLDETTPVRPDRGSDYAESKAAAEDAVVRAARLGLGAVILRPGCVYGPYSRTFTVRPIEYLKKGGLVLAGSAGTPSNTVYVDNLVHAIVRGLECSDEVAKGQAFAISDGDEMTWGDFYGHFARAMGVEVRVEPAAPPTPVHTGGGMLGWGRSFWECGVTIVKSQEFRSFGRRILETDPIGYLPRNLLGRSPGLERRLLRLLGTDAAVIYRPPAVAAEDLLRFRPHPGALRVDQVRRALGYEPPVTRERAMALTLEWLRAARLA